MSVGVLVRIGVWTDSAGPSSVILFAVLVFVDACKSLVFFTAVTDLASPSIPLDSHCLMTLLSSFVTEQLLVFLAGGGGEVKIEVKIVCACGVLVSFSSLSSMISSSKCCSGPSYSSSSVSSWEELKSLKREE